MRGQIQLFDSINVRETTSRQFLELSLPSLQSILHGVLRGFVTRFLISPQGIDLFRLLSHPLLSRVLWSPLCVGIQEDVCLASY